MKEYTYDDYTVLVGESAKENWNILSGSKCNDIFFHLSSFPSCYVILRSSNNVNDTVPNKMIHICAELCKQNTKYKNMKNIKVDYCLCSNVIFGNSVGVVSYKSNHKVKYIMI